MLPARDARRRQRRMQRDDNWRTRRPPPLYIDWSALAACVGVGAHSIGLIVNDGLFVVDNDNIDTDGLCLCVFNINCIWRQRPQVAYWRHARAMPSRAYIRHWMIIPLKASFPIFRFPFFRFPSIRISYSTAADCRCRPSGVDQPLQSQRGTSVDCAMTSWLW